jgi:hypothetical protein
MHRLEIADHSLLLRREIIEPGEGMPAYYNCAIPNWDDCISAGTNKMSN